MTSTYLVILISKGKARPASKSKLKAQNHLANGPALTTSTKLQYTLMQSFADHEIINNELSTFLPAQC